MKNVQNTHNYETFDDLHDVLLTIVGAFNRPQRDELMIKESGIQLDRALFPLLVQISRFGPIGVVELADRVGRDYTTVSRQVAKLEETGLAQRQKNSKDKRVNEAVITEAGKAMTDKIDATRAQIYSHVFEEWQDHERTELTRLLRKLVMDFAVSESNKKSG
ncbi:Transcriptional regulator SlyA [Dickeya dianthicola]|uniref:MarR family transcriptional regulator n=1 Tax=Dickeya dianthicola TaxID=204039 RepID=A0AAP6VHQ5_9GAMM|nr:MarR family winged helix-turn-helix transcriptional regulator [Dickeya dianthicola]AYC18487.1 Transcriptional regulator SlyA [Dickeya dianthicola]MBI0438749.1 winged helix-turn-helix transcriptional regulator [Dickeya dianthicola]MBI0449893.1 winged helix-turn-helix transcriptional regulator [Dickeya dianthicola]MBI0454456.1 winged helix-turn-helix transcriptional regulator [Dickeya dianthicola]MBI0458699.1 winged helix-turn-helix transcriptional regulator [Dickeya dianthicola]